MFCVWYGLISKYRSGLDAVLYTCASLLCDGRVAIMRVVLEAEARRSPVSPPAGDL